MNRLPSYEQSYEQATPSYEHFLPSYEHFLPSYEQVFGTFEQTRLLINVFRNNKFRNLGLNWVFNGSRYLG